MSKRLVIPFEHLFLYKNEIGIHRDRSVGFKEVFKVRTLCNLPFENLANKIRKAYNGEDVPAHAEWPLQRETLRWLVDRGRDGIYALDEEGIKVRPCLHRSSYIHDGHQRSSYYYIYDGHRRSSYYYIDDGHHRAFALYILGEKEIRGRVSRPAPRLLTGGFR